MNSRLCAELLQIDNHVFFHILMPCSSIVLLQPSAYPKISHAKANTCVAVKSSSRAYGLKYLIGKDGVSPVGAEVFARVLNQISITGGNMAAFQGGVLIREKGSGIIVGSVGVSGAAGDEDEFCALSGVKECMMGEQLVTEPLEHSCKTISSLRYGV